MLGLTLLIIASLSLGYLKGKERASEYEMLIDQPLVDAIQMCVELVPGASMKVDNKGNFLCYLEQNDESFQ